MAGRFIGWIRCLPVKRLAAVLAIVVLCYVVAGSPPPSVNEPHYLGKARHYWNPEWCKGDFFLESADAHEVFYWTFGWLTQYFTLSQTAWIGRLTVWTLFAIAWTSLVRRFTIAHWPSVVSAAILMPLIHFGHLSGEWLIGGVEAKGFAWAFVFFGVTKVVERKWWCVWPLLGIASSFHILVGGWAVVACLIAWCFRRKEEQLSFTELAVWLVIGGSLALPGLVPAIQLTAQSTAEDIREANLTYTFRRLSHHLVFYRFAQWNPLHPDFNVTRPTSFAIVVLGWFMLGTWQPNSDRLARLRAVVNGSLLIAAAGIAMDFLLGPFPATRAGIMRYYWFRLSDVLVPSGIAVTLLTGFSLSQTRQRAIVAACLIAAIVGMYSMSHSHGMSARSTALQQQSWRGVLKDSEAGEIDNAWGDACEWIRNDPAMTEDSVFLTPTRQQTFKWYAHRPDAVTWKDVPQDAAGLNAWWERRRQVYLLGEWPWQDLEAWANIRATTGVTHVIWPLSASSSRQPVPDGVEQVYRNDLFRVFKLPENPVR